MKRRTKNKKEKPLKTFWRAEKGTGKRKSARSEKRFAASVVVMIAFISTAMLLLLVSLIRSQSARIAVSHSAVGKNGGDAFEKTVPVRPYIFSGTGAESFQLMIPAGWKGWAYRRGMVKSPIDDAVSDGYLKIYLPNRVYGNSKTNSPNLDSLYDDIITVMVFSADEWKAMERKCNRGNKNICGDMGKKLADTTCTGLAGNEDCIYSYVKQPNCGGSHEVRCNEVDKIIESFKIVK